MLERKANVVISGGFDPIPMDKYTAQIVDVNYKMCSKYKSTEMEEKLEYKFAILDDKPLNENGDSTRGRFMWSRVRQVISSKSSLYKLAKAVYGRDLTSEEQKEVAENPQVLVGKQITIMVEQTEKDGNVYSNITSYSKVSKQLTPVENTPKEQVIVETATKPVIPTAEMPDMMPGLDPFLDEIKEEDEEEDVAEEDEEDLEALEAKLAEAKAKKAKKTTK